MRLLLDEVAEAERIIETDAANVKPAEGLVLLARYYKQIKELSPKETKAALREWLKTQTLSKIDDWGDFIDRIVANAKKYPLLQAKELVVTQSEMDKIQALKKKNQQKLAFVLLVLAKYGNAKSSKNNNWVLTQQYNVFQLARVVGDSRWSTMRELKEVGLIEFAHKVDNINVRVTFINEDSEPVMTITDLRELGYRYLKYTGEDFIECQECGVLVRKTCINKKYCKDCAGYQPVIKKKVQCVDCGEWFEVDARIVNKCRCEYCQSQKVKNDTRKRINKLRKTADCNEAF